MLHVRIDLLNLDHVLARGCIHRNEQRCHYACHECPDHCARKQRDNCDPAISFSRWLLFPIPCMSGDTSFLCKHCVIYHSTIADGNRHISMHHVELKGHSATLAACSSQAMQLLTLHPHLTCRRRLVRYAAMRTRQHIIVKALLCSPAVMVSDRAFRTDQAYFSLMGRSDML